MNLAVNTDMYEVFHSQQVFRLLMEAMARPGKPVKLPGLSLNSTDHISPALGDLILALLDNETHFAVYPYDQRMDEYIQLFTGAHNTTSAMAEFIILDGQAGLNESVAFSTGSLLFPEKAATLLIAVDTVNQGTDFEHHLRLRGPGINEYRDLYLNGLHPDVIHKIQHLNREFPLGVDSILFDKRGEIVCIPRSTLIEEVE